MPTHLTTTDLGVTVAGTTIDVVFVGAGTGLPYGSCNVSDMATPFTQAAAQNTWYTITDAEIVSGPLNLMTHAAGVITSTNAGTFSVNWAVAIDSATPNKHFSVGVSINGAAPTYHMSRYVTATSQETIITGTRIVTLTAGQTLSLQIRTVDTGNPVLNCDHFSLTAVMVGG